MMTGLRGQWRLGSPAIALALLLAAAPAHADSPPGGDSGGGGAPATTTPQDQPARVRRPASWGKRFATRPARTWAWSSMCSSTATVGRVRQSSISAASSASAAARSRWTGGCCSSSLSTPARPCCSVWAVPTCRRRPSTSHRAAPVSRWWSWDRRHRRRAHRLRRMPRNDRAAAVANRRGQYWVRRRKRGRARPRLAQPFRRQHPDRLRAVHRRLSDHPGLDADPHRLRPQPRHRHRPGKPSASGRPGRLNAQQERVSRRSLSGSAAMPVSPRSATASAPR